MSEGYRNYDYSSQLSDAITSYIEERRALGFLANAEAKMFCGLDRLACGMDLGGVSLPKPLALAWLEKKPGMKDRTVIGKLTVLKGFANYLRRNGITAYVPCREDLPRMVLRDYVPHIFTHREMKSIFAFMRSDSETGLAGDKGLAIVLAYCCGLRIREVTTLRVEDVDRKNAILSVRDGKFRKSRFVPLAADVCEALGRHIDGHPGRSFVFESRNGLPVSTTTVYAYFRKVLFGVGIPHRGRGHGPRLHDLRHTFAVHSLHNWVVKGVPLSSALPRLSEYLGHKNPAATEKYLHMTAEFFPEIVNRAFAYVGAILPEEAEHE